MACSLGAFGGALGEQAFVDVPFDIRVHRGPLFHVDQIDDQSPERRWILDFWPSLFEDLSKHPRLLAKFLQDVPVVGFELVPFPLEQALPVVFGGNDRRLVVRWLRLFMGHLEEQQERDLFGIGHVRKPIVTQNVSEVPGFVDDLLGVVVAHFNHPAPTSRFQATSICCLGNESRFRSFQAWIRTVASSGLVAGEGSYLATQCTLPNNSSP